MCITAQIHNHYYPFGLKIAGLSSKKLPDVLEGSLKNNKGYQGEYSDFDDDLSWNDFDLRTYDPQIGRWLQQDPYDEFSSPFVGMGNDPINFTDPSGGGIFEGLVNAGLDKVLTRVFIGAVAGGAIGAFSGQDAKSAFKGMLLGGLLGIGDLNIASSLVVQVGALSTKALAEELTKKAISQNGSSPRKGNPKKSSNPFTNFIDDINKSLEIAKKMLESKQKRLVRWNEKDKKDFKNHFGVDDNKSRKKISNIVTKEIKLIGEIQKGIKNGTYKFNIRNDYYASVNPSDKKHIITLGPDYVSASLKGINSKAGTLIHEMSHFDDIGGLRDFGSQYYGITASKALTKNPAMALNHADSFEYYIENAW